MARRVNQFPGVLRELRDFLRKLNVSLGPADIVLLAYYKSGEGGPRHADDEDGKQGLDLAQPITVFSMGGSRKVWFTNFKDQRQVRVTLNVEDGAVYIMRGTKFQKLLKHEVSKGSGYRFSISFRTSVLETPAAQPGSVSQPSHIEEHERSMFEAESRERKLTREVERLSQEIVRREEDSRARNTDFCAYASELHGEIERLEAATTRPSGGGGNFPLQVARLKVELNRAKEEAKALREALAKRESMVKAQREVLAERGREVKAKGEALTLQVAKVEAAREEAKALREALNKRESMLKAQREVLAERGKEVKTKREALTDAETERKGHLLRIASLEQELRTVKTEREKLVRETNELKERIRKMNQELREKGREMTDWKTKKKELERRDARQDERMKQKLESLMKDLEERTKRRRNI